jgi:protein-S-isoprenylcysteine O-methyltransferase Ste14
MMLNIFIILVYLSFTIEFFAFPISSEASTVKLSRNVNRFRKFGLYLIFITNLVFYCFPIYLSINQFNEGFSANIISITGIVIAMAGRFVTMSGAYLLHNKDDSLITSSLFYYTRNPISLGLHLTIFGVLLIVDFWPLWIFFALYLTNIHLKIKIEERHLLQLIGARYKQYMIQTPRYLGL